MSGRLVSIQLHGERGEPMRPVQAVEAIAGEGLEGDRYRSPAHLRQKGDELTLVEAEALDRLRDERGIDIGLEGSRRNLTTRGIDLNALVGRRFRVGAIECEGVEPCHPCRHLERVTEDGVLKGLAGRGGLVANVRTSGRIAVGDPVEPC